MFEVMGGEPWCFTPAEIGLLTDRQVWDQYVRPAVERQEASRPPERRHRGKGCGFPTRETYIAMGVASVPDTSQEHWAAEYDAWAASEDGKRFLTRQAARKENRRGRIARRP